MTVGVAAITEFDTDDRMVLLGADRLLTTRQLSAIEHEHSESKISKIGESLPATNLQCVVSGAISLGEELKERIERRIQAEAQEHGAAALGVQHVAGFASEEYRGLIQDKIQNVILSSYGLELDDLSKQHQFKDNFMNSVLTEVENAENEIQDNLKMLLGGVDTTGAYIYEISNNDHTSHVNPGYATIGSGTQPAESKFIKSNYSKSCDLNQAMSVVGSALYEAQEASGVGGEVDIAVISTDSNRALESGTVSSLMDREEDIVDAQEDLREEHIEENTIDWGIQQ